MKNIDFCPEKCIATYNGTKIKKRKERKMMIPYTCVEGVPVVQFMI